MLTTSRLVRSQGFNYRRGQRVEVWELEMERERFEVHVVSSRAVDCSGGELEVVGGSDGGPVYQGIVVAPERRRWGAEVEWCSVIRDLEYPR
jgi:hypothetical protein